MSSARSILVGDIGGTNARFGIVQSGSITPGHMAQRQAADFETLEAAIKSYLANEAKEHSPTHACIAVASPVLGDEIKLTNNHWQFSISEMKKSLGLEELTFINDFTAQALAIPHLPNKHITPIGPDVKPLKDRPIAVVGPGTGLGVSGLVPNDSGGWVALAGEGGHANVSPENEFEMKILRFAWQEFGRTSIERLLSGAGLEFLYRAVCNELAPGAPALPAADITKAALEGSNKHARETVDLFCAFLGGFAGDLALILGAHGGVYIAGGIIPRFGELFAQSPFRARFENKGRFEAYNAAIPTFLVTPDENPALLGAASVYFQP